MNNFLKEILLILLKVALPIIVVLGIVYISFNFNFELTPKVMYFALIAVFFVLIFIIPYVYKRVKNNYKNNIATEDMPYEFRKIYMDLYNTHIVNLEKMRKKVRWRTVAQFTAFALFFVGYVFGKTGSVLISPTVDALLLIIGIISFFIGILLTYLNYKYVKKYKNTYKTEIIADFVKLLNDKLAYVPYFTTTSQIQKDYKEANFENRSFNRFSADDYIKGNLDTDITIKLVDIHLQNVTGSGRNRHTEEIFQGIFGLSKCNKNINTYIKVSKNKFKLFDNNARLEMDSQEFEKYFDIYSEDKILAMRILTADTMEYLIKFYEKYKLEFEIVFKNDKIYLRFFTGPMFEPKIFGNSMDKELLFVYYSILDFVLQVTKKVNKTLQEIEI